MGNPSIQQHQATSISYADCHARASRHLAPWEWRLAPGRQGPTCARMIAAHVLSRGCTTAGRPADSSTQWHLTRSSTHRSRRTQPCPRLARVRLASGNHRLSSAQPKTTRHHRRRHEPGVHLRHLQGRVRRGPRLRALHHIRLRQRVLRPRGRGVRLLGRDRAPDQLPVLPRGGGLEWL